MFNNEQIVVETSTSGPRICLSLDCDMFLHERKQTRDITRMNKFTNLNITAAIDDRYGEYMPRCYTHMLADDPSIVNCLHVLDSIAHAVIALSGIDLNIVPLYANDWSVTGPMIHGLLGDNRSHDIVLDSVGVTHMRMETGVRYSNALGADNIIMVTKSNDGRSTAPNLRILTEQFDTHSLVFYTVAFIILLIMFYIRQWISSTSTNNVLTMTTSIFAISTTVFYQAVIARSLLIQEPIDMQAAALCIKFAWGNGQ